MAPRKRTTTKKLPPIPVNTASPSRTPSPTHVESEGQPIDEALTLFLRRPPSAADHFITRAQGIQGTLDDVVIVDASVKDATETPGAFADQLVKTCAKWARSEGRELRFRGTWQAGDRVLASYGWRAGEGSTQPLDGSTESFLAQQQRHLETMMRLHHEAHEMVQDGWAKLLSASQKRCEALEALANDQADRLRRAGDVDAEIAINTVAADIETRARTQEIMQQRLLPLVEALIVKSISGGLVAAPAAADEKQSSAEQ